MRPKFIEAYMKTAETFAKLSSARKLHVGAIIVKDDRIVSIGYNGMPSGWDNNCETMVSTSPWPAEQGDYENITYELKTKPEVLHAETNAIAKLAKSTESGDGAAMFITHAPCLECAKLIYQSGINSVYYRNAYRNEDGVEFLNKCNIAVNKI